MTLEVRGGRFGSLPADKIISTGVGSIVLH